MKKLALALIILSSNHYAHGMLRRVARSVSNKNVIKGISKISRLIQKRLHSRKVVNSKLTNQAQSLGEKVGYYKARENVIKSISEKFNCTFDIKRKGKYISSLFVKHDNGALAVYFSSQDQKSCIAIDESLYNLSENNYENEQRYPGFIAGYREGYKQGNEQALEDYQSFFYQCKLFGVEFDEKTQE